MAKNKYKSIILLTTILASTILPTYTFAEKTTIKSVSKSIESDLLKISNPYLGPDNLKRSLQEVSNNAFMLDVFAKTVIKTPDFSFDGNIFSDWEDKDLLNTVLKDQRDSKDNANYWLNTLKPHMIKINQNIITSGTKFNNQSDAILDAIHTHDKEKLENLIRNLYQSNKLEKESVTSLLTSLNTFREKLTENTKQFKGNATELSHRMAGNSALVTSLNTSLQLYKKQLADEIESRISLGVVVPLTLVPIIGIPLWGLYGMQSDDISKTENEIEILTKKISGVESQSVVLISASETSKQFADKIDTAIDSVQGLSHQWNIVDAKYSTLLQNIETLGPDELELLEIEVHIAQDSWKNLMEYATSTYKELIEVPKE
ncbi:HBL/NHE enterotoxin family protein [Bacillus thuringiensis]|uniref:HBL/NHE enterotoxin family protein n=1 Tax=Bacillus thuringiensis TaxID=1428 RepID=UPI003B97DA1E